MVRLKLKTKMDYVFLSPIVLYLSIIEKFYPFFKTLGFFNFSFLYLSVLQEKCFEYTWIVVDDGFLIEESKKNKNYEEMKIQVQIKSIPTIYLNAWSGKVLITENNECVLDLSETSFEKIEDILNHFSLPLFNGNFSYDKILEEKNDCFV